jgi:peptidoglycan hydrolase-like protein with peptidoglycan-binding domain
MEDKKPHSNKPTPKDFARKLDEVVPTPPKKEAEPAPVSAPPKSLAPRTAYAVVSGKNQDDVHLSKAVYKNTARKRSLTVHHIQRRLTEWGHYDAFLDKDGFYGDSTKKSVIEFQDRMGIIATGLMDIETMTKLFENDTNVVVHLS